MRRRAAERLALGAVCAGAVLGLAGCVTTGGLTSKGSPVDPAALNANPPAYWDAQRYYVENRMPWGFVKRPGDPWNKAFLALLNEDQCLAPHRSMDRKDADQNMQYKFYGQWWDKKAYDPVMNRLLPVFVLQRFEPVGVGQPLGQSLQTKAGTPERDSRAAARSADRPPETIKVRSYEEIE